MLCHDGTRGAMSSTARGQNLRERLRQASKLNSDMNIYAVVVQVFWYLLDHVLLTSLSLFRQCNLDFTKSASPKKFARLPHPI